VLLPEPWQLWRRCKVEAGSGCPAADACAQSQPCVPRSQCGVRGWVGREVILCRLMSRKQQQQRAASGQTHRPHTEQACKRTATSSKNLYCPGKQRNTGSSVEATPARWKTWRNDSQGYVGATMSCIGWHWDCGLVCLVRDSSRALAASMLRCFDDGVGCGLACVRYGLCVCALAASSCCCSLPPFESMQNAGMIPV
jgi:hypothetical protein